MRLGRDILEADLYGELGLLPDATESEIRVAYRHKVRASHPDLNQHDPEAVPRMARLNVAAKVLLDPASRRTYDRRPRQARSQQSPSSPSSPSSRSPGQAAWFERSEQDAGSDWAEPAAAPREQRANFGSFFSELRGRDGQVTLRVSELVESLSGRQQLGVAALLCAIALGLIVMARPHVSTGDAEQATSGNMGSGYP